ncbi:MFS transporter [Eleftheria terrae]|uniref:MFS transporter n=1 Tax=Eleftheria terrae TaxID=1597781 RepID=UPI00263B7387|nr:MFS transporter [Eleftheria terrae]WKB51689.1 MFS transporter [Eleftheria terrae]
MSTRTVLDATGTADPTAWQRWSIFVVFAASYVWVYFHRMAPAVVSADLKAAFGVTAAELGSLAATYYYVSALTQIPSGLLADRVGNRITLTLANLVAGIGSIAFGLASSFAQATLGRFLVGLGVSVVFVCFMKSNAAWTRPAQYGLISGLTLLIGNLGSVLAGTPLDALLHRHSWRWVFIGIGLVSLVLAAVAAAVVRNAPEQRQAPFLARPPRVAPGAGGGLLPSLASVLKRRRLWPVFFVNLGMLGSYYALSGLWAVPFLQDVHRLGRSDSAFLVTASLLGLAAGSFCLGAWSDRLGKRRPILLGSVLAYLGLLAVLVHVPLDAGAGSTVLCFLLGAAAGGFVLTYGAAKDEVPVAAAGLAVSVVNTGVFLGASIIQSGYGWILDLHWAGSVRAGVRAYPVAAYDAAHGFMLGAAALALLAALCVRDRPGPAGDTG